jgi:hypothetical protein
MLNKFIIFCPKKSFYSSIKVTKLKQKNNELGFNFLKNKHTFSLNSYSLTQNRVNSNASRKSYKLKTFLPIQSTNKYKYFFYKNTSHKGRSKNGILCRTKGRVSKKKNN